MSMTNEQLVEEIKAGKNVQESMLQLWKQNKGIICKIIRKYLNNAEFEDLEQQSYLGLYEAVKRYDPQKEVLFLTYASYWIEQNMQRYISKCCIAVRIPVIARDNAMRYERVAQEFQKQHGRWPSEAEAREILGVSEERFNTIKRCVLSLDALSLDCPVGREDEEYTLGDTVATESDVESDVLTKLDGMAMKETLWAAVDELPDNLPILMRCIYQDNMSIDEVVQKLGISKSQAYRAEQKALYILRLPWNSKNYRHFLECC